MKRAFTIVALAGLLGCRVEEINTTVVVTVESDLNVPADMDAVDVVVAGGELHYPFALGSDSGQKRLPIRVALVPGGKADRQFEVDAVGMRLNAEIISQSAVVSFVPGTEQELVLFLGRNCLTAIAPNCPADSTCQDGICAKNSVAGTRLPFGSDAGAPDHIRGDADGDTANGAVSDASCVGAEKAICGNACVDLASSNANCGVCDYACVGGRTCTAGRCAPAWLPMSLSGQPMAKSGYASASVSGKLLITGGPCDGPAVASSMLYDPGTDRWAPTGDMGSPRSQHRLVSSGSKVYAFGGLTNCLNGTTVGPGLEVFDPATGSWTPISASNAPAPRYAFSMAWTGAEVFVFGGSTNTALVASGGRYNPTTNSWTDASCSVGDCVRAGAYLFADGGYLRMWGGVSGDAPTGRQFDLSIDTWSPWTVPAGRVLPGEFPDDGKRILAVQRSGTGDCSDSTTVEIYDRATGTLLATDPSVAPDGITKAGAQVWTGTEVISWSGGCGTNPTNGGGRYQPPAP